MVAIDTVTAAMTNFGSAGLIGLLWILERRYAAHKDRQLDEAHRAAVDRRSEVEALHGVVKENSAAISRLEEVQHRLVDLIERLGMRRLEAH